MNDSNSTFSFPPFFFPYGEDLAVTTTSDPDWLSSFLSDSTSSTTTPSKPISDSSFDVPVFHPAMNPDGFSFLDSWLIGPTLTDEKSLSRQQVSTPGASLSVLSPNFPKRLLTSTRPPFLQGPSSLTPSPPRKTQSLTSSTLTFSHNPSATPPPPSASPPRFLLGPSSQKTLLGTDRTHSLSPASYPAPPTHRTSIFFISRLRRLPHPRAATRGEGALKTRSPVAAAREAARARNRTPEKRRKRGGEGRRIKGVSRAVSFFLVVFPVNRHSLLPLLS
jgi:hypothetical protein